MTGAEEFARTISPPINARLALLLVARVKASCTKVRRRFTCAIQAFLHRHRIKHIFR